MSKITTCGAHIPSQKNWCYIFGKHEKNDIDGSQGVHPRSTTIASLVLATGLRSEKFQEYHEALFSALLNLNTNIERFVKLGSLTDLDKSFAERS